MKVALFYSEAAGDGVTLAELRATLTSGGHQLVSTVERHANPERLLNAQAELVVAAGGDGTVAEAARLVAGRDVPLALLPIGTANNIALGLGIRGTLAEIVDSWASATRRPLDLGRVHCAGVDSLFLEAAGGGLIPSGIAAHQAQPGAQEAPVDQKLPDAIRAYRDALGALKPRRCTVTLDGTSMTDDFLMVEALNMRAVGPNLELAEADPSDGRLSVVVATEAHRGEIDEYLRALDAGDAVRLSLGAVLARDVEVRGWDRLHIDDRLVSVLDGASVSAHIEPAALVLLTETDPCHRS
jgi:diacylglycerol kinase family enzyme